MPYDVRAIANFTLTFASARGVNLSNVTINKIVFFLHAWYLARTGLPLVTAKVEAWNYGPVFRELYSEFKKFGRLPITGKATRRNPSTVLMEECIEPIANDDAAFLNALLERYVRLSASELIELSHVQGGPWDQVYHHDGKSNPGMQISDELIKSYFSRQTRH